MERVCFEGLGHAARDALNTDSRSTNQYRLTRIPLD